MIYLDYAATTPIDPEILTAYYELLQKYFANAASHHPLGGIVSSLQTRARIQIAQAFRVQEEEIIFTSGASEANNLAIKGVAFKYKNRGKHLITSVAEHPSVLNAFKQLEEEFGYTVTYLEVNNQGKISSDDLQKALMPGTILVSLMSVNNEVGSINDIAKLSTIVKQNSKAFFHSDMTQSIGKIDIDISHVDLISCSAHKLYGLKGSGLLIKRSQVDLLPQISGGGHEFGLRSGTSNWPINVMLAKTLRLCFEQKNSNYAIVDDIHRLVHHELSNMDEVEINSPFDCSPYILNFSIKHKKASVVVQALEEAGICVSTLSACSSKLEKPSQVIQSMFGDYKRAISSIRLSFSKYTKQEEVVTFIEALKRILDTMK